MKKILLFVLPLVLSLSACEKVKKTEGVGESTTTTGGVGPLGTALEGDTQESGGSLSVANVILKPGTPQAFSLTVEIARTPEERARGLQERENLPEDHGMWFVFEQDVTDSFWMHNTPISLDILFIGADYKIVDLVEKAPPNSDDLITPHSPYRFALEVAAGAGDRHGLHVGDAVEFRLGPP